MQKILDKPINGWTAFHFGPFTVSSVSYLTEVHWDLIEFFQDCLLRGCGIVEFDCEDSGRFVLSYSSLGMELRDGFSDDLIWENVNRNDIESGSIRLLTDLVIDFDSWSWWSSTTESERDEAAEDLAMMLEDFCNLLIHEQIIDCRIKDIIPDPIREMATNARTAIARKRGGNASAMNPTSDSMQPNVGSPSAFSADMSPIGIGTVGSDGRYISPAGSAGYYENRRGYFVGSGNAGEIASRIRNSSKRF